MSVLLRLFRWQQYSLYGCIRPWYQVITKTYLYNFDPLKPHFLYIKTGLTVVYIIFSYFCSKNIDCRQSLEPPLRGFGKAILTNTHNLGFEQKYEKISEFLCENFQFLVMKFSIYRCVFVLSETRVSYIPEWTQWSQGQKQRNKKKKKKKNKKKKIKK